MKINHLLISFILLVCSISAHSANDLDLEHLLDQDFSNEFLNSDQVQTIDPALLEIFQEHIKDSSMNVSDKEKKEWFIPLQLDSSDLTKVAIAGSAAVIAFSSDRQIMDFVQDHRNGVTSVASTIGEFYGSEFPVYAAAGGLILGVVIKNKKIKRVALLTTKAMVVTGLVTRALKMSFGRIRPNKTDNPYEFDGPNLSNNNVSFPSGHTTTAFAFATVMAEEFKEYKAVPVLAYSAAALAGWSRVHGTGDGKPAHWASDVIMGGLIGHIFAKQAINSKLSQKGILLSPGLSPQGDLMIHIQYTKKPKRNELEEVPLDFN